MCCDFLDGTIAVKKCDIGKEEASWCNLHPKLRPYTNLTFLGLLPEPGADRILPGGMIVLSHGALLNLTVDVFCVRVEGTAQVFLNRNESCCGCHGSS